MQCTQHSNCFSRPAMINAAHTTHTHMCAYMISKCLADNQVFGQLCELSICLVFFCFFLLLAFSSAGLGSADPEAACVSFCLSVFFVFLLFLSSAVSSAAFRFLLLLVVFGWDSLGSLGGLIVLVHPCAPHTYQHDECERTGMERRQHHGQCYCKSLPWWSGG